MSPDQVSLHIAPLVSGYPLYSDGSLLLGIDFLGAISRVHFLLQDQYILPLSRALYFLRLFQNYLYLCYIEP